MADAPVKTNLLKFSSFAITATSTAAPLSATDLWVSQIVINNNAAAFKVYVGDSSVAAAAGFPVAAGGALSFDSALSPQQISKQINLKNVYVVCSGGETADVRVGYVAERFT